MDLEFYGGLEHQVLQDGGKWDNPNPTKMDTSKMVHPWCPCQTVYAGRAVKQMSCFVRLA